MTPFDREVRAAIYRHLAESGAGPSAEQLAEIRDWSLQDVGDAYRRLEAEHRIALVPGALRVWMAHPFSGVPTTYAARVGERSWYANCAWDALAILALMGDGQAILTGLPDELVWKVEDGRVTPEGLIHVRVPARDFWVDVGFT